MYCAPEVINDNKTTAQTDIFAAGITLFQMANNISNLGALVSSLDTIKFGRVIPSIGHKGYVPRRLRYICNKACAFDPARRYSSADEMRQALERLHVKQDWTKPSAGIWQANVNGQAHEMTVDTAPTIEMVYKINARRRNANCKKCATIVLAEVEQDNWVYKHTF